MSKTLRSKILGAATLASALLVTSAQAQAGAKAAPAKAPAHAMAPPKAAAAPAAAAPITLAKSLPAKDASVASATVIKLTFSGKPMLKGSTISASDASGAAVKLGKVTMVGNTLSAAVMGKLAEGAYTVNYSAADAAGPATGSFSFTVKAAPMKQAAAPKAPPKVGG